MRHRKLEVQREYIATLPTRPNIYSIGLRSTHLLPSPKPYHTSFVYSSPNAPSAKCSVVSWSRAFLQQQIFKQRICAVHHALPYVYAYAGISPHAMCHFSIPPTF